MTYKISQIPVHDTNPARTNMVESEQAGGTSVYSSIDEILNPIMPAVTQLQGYTIANVAEVEANKALRVTPKPRDMGSTADSYGFAISHHHVGFQAGVTLTTAAASSMIMMAAGWFGPGHAVINKCTIALVLSALSGVRAAGQSVVHLRSCYLIDVGPGTFLRVPPITPASGNFIDYYSSLRMRQPEPQLQISAADPTASGGVSPTAQSFLQSIGVARNSCVGVAGNVDIPPFPIFDAYADGSYMPYVLEKNRGILIHLDAPAAGTSQALGISITLSWDEWIPYAAMGA